MIRHSLSIGVRGKPSGFISIVVLFILRWNLNPFSNDLNVILLGQRYARLASGIQSDDE